MGRGLCKPILETMHGGTCLLYMKFTPIAIPNNEAQFLETRKFQIEEIARMKLSITLDTLTARILKLSSDSQS